MGLIHHRPGQRGNIFEFRIADQRGETTEDGGIVASEKYMKATITVSEGVTVDLTFDPDSKEVTEASGTGIEATYSNNLLSLVTTSEDGATSTTNYTVSVSEDNATATITPTTDGAPTVNQIVSSDSAVEFSTTATFGDFEVSFGTDSKVASVTYTPDTTQQVTFLSERARRSTRSSAT